MGNTLAKTKILGIIRNSSHPATYASIKKLMGNAHSRISIYRILLRLENENLIQRFVDLNGDFRYLAGGKPIDTVSQQSHFQCQICNTLYQLKTENLKAKVPEEYAITKISFLASGVCPQCANHRSV